ncbi:hypothetical protein FVR03_24020 [Pontibacter qinzhouensis]|uniref:Uncharacterized protein n=1 Tax=Pontibacter qinzhouensis TaxID=2603253 RepID=A0A5C8IC73_9BACT|nr:hypothetical protein [Pontibacter qinzhouensis]TXK18387.1 hypothetical protein FVR03_24020 [Pontibacter qinzhouensis]
MRQIFLFAQIFVLALLLSCTNQENSQLKSDSAKAYADFKEFVIQVENDAVSELDDSTKIWEDEASKLKEKYASLEDDVNDLIDQYPPQDRETIQDFKERFRIAMDQKQKKYDDAQAQYRLRQDLLGEEVASADLYRIEASNITATYQKFVNTIVKNKDVYTHRDWEMIEGWWSALNARKNEIQAQLQPADEKAIRLKEDEYLELRNQVAGTSEIGIN